MNDHGFPVVGVDSLRAVSQFATLDAVLTQGRSFTQAELDAGAKVCVISEALAAANGLSLGDQMTIQYYETDGALNGNMVPQKLANPAAAYYSPRLGFSGEPASYEIVGLYRQRDQWSYGIQSFTPNTVFVPNSVMPAGASSIAAVYLPPSCWSTAHRRNWSSWPATVASPSCLPTTTRATP